MTNRIKVIGCGGIGTRLLYTLSHYLNYSKKENEITIIDGDSFEDRNKERQIFNLLGNKAKITADDLAKKYSNVVFRAREQYITLANVEGYIRNDDIVFLCVDNHNSRKLISDRCEELDDVLLISGGNDYHDGNVQVFLRQEAVSLTHPLASKYHPEIMYPKDKNPGLMKPKDKMHCLEDAKANPQLLFANNAIASAMCSAYYAWEQKKLTYDEVYIDILTGVNRPVKRA